MEIPEESMLEIIAEERVCNSLESLICNNEEFRSSQMKLDEAVMNLEKADLTKKQEKMIDEVLAISNYCGAVYGSLAYEQGLVDGIKLIIEINQKSQSDCKTKKEQ